MEKNAVSGIMLILLVTSILAFGLNIQPVKASGTIYIRADGSVEPSTARIHREGDVYIITGNIADSIVIERNNITLDGLAYTIQGTGAGSEGILLSGRSNVTVKNTQVTGFGIGISVNSGSNNSISGNTLANNGDGILLHSSSNNSISGNNIRTNNHRGVGASDGVSNVISGNNITNSDDGISVYSGSNNTISGNTIADNLVGIVLTDCYFSCNISGNTIANNGEGIRSIFSSGNSIYHNNFIGNTKQFGGYRSGRNTWDDGYPSGGNYWSDYTGADADGDGIGDTSYVVNANDQDLYPLVSPWGKIPEWALPSPSFWMQWWFYAIVAVIIVASAGAVFFLKRRKPPKPTASPLLTEGT